jgi:uncharacterized integral membrane protein
MMVALKLMVQDRPLLIVGTPGLLLILVSMLTGSLLVQYYNVETYFSVPLALLTFSFLIIGTLLIISSLIFYALSLLRTEIRKTRYSEEYMS